MSDKVDSWDQELFERSETTEAPTTIGVPRPTPMLARESSLPKVGIEPSRRAEGATSLAELRLPPSLQPLPFEARYTQERVLGRGGMGEVRLCRDHSIGRDVAMKVVRPPKGASRESLERRFVREARVQGQLEHPSIVPVYDAGIAPDGALYFTMKRVRGVSLAHVLRELHDRDVATMQRYSRRRLLAIFSQVCMAVHYGHQKGVVHRDVKPANVMLGDFGEVYLLDWGLAALRGDPVSEGPDSVDDGHGVHTLATGMVGTPGYMAPEQIEQAQAIDARADHLCAWKHSVRTTQWAAHARGPLRGAGRGRYPRERWRKSRAARTRT